METLLSFQQVESNNQPEPAASESSAYSCEITWCGDTLEATGTKAPTERRGWPGEHQGMVITQWFGQSAVSHPCTWDGIQRLHGGRWAYVHVHVAHLRYSLSLAERPVVPGTGNPSITFWKVVYRRHTSFALESIEQTFNGSVNFGKKVSCTVSRNGDLVSTMWVEITLKKGSGATYYPGENFIKECELELGGQKLDKHYSDWYRVYDELFRSNDEKSGYRRLTDFDNPAAGSDTGVIKRMFVPLIFFFNRNAGLALPLIALQYHELKISLTLASESEMTAANVDTSYIPTATLYATYVFLDTDERRRYAQTSHEYLIEQLQHTGSETITPASAARTQNFRLSFNHPCKFLAFVVKGATHGEFTSVGKGTTDARFTPISSVKLQLNGHDRFSERKFSFFNYVQPWEHLKSKPCAGVGLYSFALRPDEHQPSGTCNFSRIDNATLIVSTKACSAANVAGVTDEDTTLSNVTGLTNLLIYSVNYNVLRVMSGMGGLAYSN